MQDRKYQLKSGSTKNTFPSSREKLEFKMQFPRTVVCNYRSNHNLLSCSCSRIRGDPTVHTVYAQLQLLFLLLIFFSHILERGNKKEGTAGEHLRKIPRSAQSKHAPSPVDEKRRVEEFEKRLRFAMEQSLYLQAQHVSALDKFEKDLTQATEESLLAHALHKSRLETSGRKETVKPLKGILKKTKT